MTSVIRKGNGKLVPVNTSDASDDLCTCSGTDLIPENRKTQTNSVAKCKPDHGKRGTRKEEKLRKKLQKKVSCVESPKKCDVRVDIGKNSVTIVNMMNKDSTSCSPHGGLKLRYRSPIPGSHKAPKERFAKTKEWENVDKLAGGLRFRYNLRSPRCERKEPAACWNVCDGKKQKRVCGPEDKVRTRTHVNSKGKRPKTASRNRYKPHEHNKDEYTGKFNCNENELHDPRKTDCMRRKSTPNDEEETKILYSRGNKRCNKDKSCYTNKSEVAAPNKCEDTYKDIKSKNNKCDALRDMQNKKPKNCHEKILERCEQYSHRKDQHCDRKRNQDDCLNKDRESESQCKCSEKQTPPRGNEELIKKQNQTCKRKSSSRDVAIRILSDTPFHVQIGDHDKKKRGNISEDEEDDETFYSSKESTLCSNCKSEEANKKPQPRPKTQNVPKERRCNICPGRPTSLDIRRERICATTEATEVEHPELKPSRDCRRSTTCNSEGNANANTQKKDHLFKIRGLCDYLLSPFGSCGSNEGSNQEQKPPCNVDKNEERPKTKSTEIECVEESCEKPDRDVKPERNTCCERELLDNIFGQIKRVKKEVKKMKHAHEEENKLADVKSVMKETGDLRKCFEALEKRCEEGKENCKALWCRVSKVEDAAEAQRVNICEVNEQMTGALERVRQHESMVIDRFNSFANFTSVYKDIIKEYYKNVSTRADQFFEAKQNTIDKREAKMNCKYEKFIQFMDDKTKKISDRIQEFKEKCEDYEKQCESQIKSIADIKSGIAKSCNRSDFEPPKSCHRPDLDPSKSYNRPDFKPPKSCHRPDFESSSKTDLSSIILDRCCDTRQKRSKISKPRAYRNRDSCNDQKSTGDIKSGMVKSRNRPDFKPQCKTDWSLILDSNCDKKKLPYFPQDRNFRSLNSCNFYSDMRRKKRRLDFENNSYAFYEHTLRQRDHDGLYNRSYSIMRSVYDNSSSEHKTIGDYQYDRQRIKGIQDKKYELNYRGDTPAFNILNKPPTPYNFRRPYFDKSKGRFSLLEKIKDFVLGPQVAESYTEATSSFATVTCVADVERHTERSL